MRFFERLSSWVRIARPGGIARRYLVTNGFDGALTMLGINMGFYLGGETDIVVVTSACLGAAVALGMSGITSAYISESAERRRALRELEEAMATDLGGTAQGWAARITPLFIALVNGLAPLVIALIVMVPLWLSWAGVEFGLPAVEVAIGLAFGMIFALGAYLGRVSGTFWLWSALRTLGIGVVTALIIFALGLNGRA